MITSKHAMAKLIFSFTLLSLTATAAVTASAFASEFLPFPKDFQWCAATSAHQIEGDNYASDWWAWEQIPGNTKNGERSGNAVDHWNQFREDALLLSKLGVTTYRFGIEWAKVEPDPSKGWNLEAVRHYQQEIAILKKLHIEPMITLQHFTLPKWVADKGGWGWDKAPLAFARYVAFVATVIAPDAKTWITVNEPGVILVLGYLANRAPPGLSGAKDPLIQAMRGMLKAHAKAYQTLHRIAAKSAKQIQVGIAHHLRVFEAASWSPLDKLAACLVNEAFNWAIPNAVETGRLKLSIPLFMDIDEEIPGLQGSEDFFGLNYYSRDMVSFTPFGAMGFTLSVAEGTPVNDLGWEIYPEGLTKIISDIEKKYPKKAIWITENGIADAKDEKRASFIKSHLSALHNSIRSGVQVLGYCHWSLLDNYEWSEGFGPRFGLYAIDYLNHYQRTPRPSASEFKKITQDNGVWVP